MKLTNKILTISSSITRQLPYHRKLNKLYKHFNRLFLAIGADSLMTAKMEDGTNMLVDISTKTERISFYTGKYDPELIKIIHSLLITDSCFLDIGANIGFYTISMGNYFKSQKFSGKIIAFEPFEGNFRRLSDNLKMNKLTDVCLLNKYGLSNKSEESQITLREDFKRGSNTGNASIPTSEEMDQGFKLSPIKLKSLDDVWPNDFEKYGKIDIMKMDIEGHEDFCLEGGSETINKYRPTILMEVNKPYYKARNVELDERFFKLIPKEYAIFRESNLKWTQINSLNECSTLDNVFLIPKEKLNLKGYHIFEN
ncbi:FkbM family methyltransferase [Flavobacteriaceae bacterium AU392]|nr:FkbM family methyltransferase [Flavobacteriaceae bacterium]RKM82780.1 FkbM family methyltransferase [Flavobacteriaceae bacterium AU392]